MSTNSLNHSFDAIRTAWFKVLEAQSQELTQAEYQELHRKLAGLVTRWGLMSKGVCFREYTYSGFKPLAAEVTDEGKIRVYRGT